MGLKKTPRFLLLSIGYAFIIQVSYLTALLLRFEGVIPPRFWNGYLQIAPRESQGHLHPFLGGRAPRGSGARTPRRA